MVTYAVKTSNGVKFFDDIVSARATCIRSLRPNAWKSDARKEIFTKEPGQFSARYTLKPYGYVCKTGWVSGEGYTWAFYRGNSLKATRIYSDGSVIQDIHNPDKKKLSKSNVRFFGDGQGNSYMKTSSGNTYKLM